jgi:hypothetical protein
MHLRRWLPKFNCALLVTVLEFWEIKILRSQLQNSSTHKKLPGINIGGHDQVNNSLNAVGPCGTCCSQCLASKADPETIKYLIERGLPAAALPCKGCRTINGYCPAPSLGGKQCGIYKCAKNLNYTFCFECTESPCDRLMPSLNTGMYRYHNMKCFNLLYIQRHGIDAFLQNAERIQDLYLKGTLKVVGESPEL